MGLDHRPFIERQQKKERFSPDADRYGQNVKILLIFLVLAASTVGFIYIAMYLDVDENARAMAPLALLFSLFIGFTAFFAFAAALNQEKSFKLLRDAIDSGRGIRLITNAAKQTVFTNRRFETLCAGVGPATFETLLKFFDNIDEKEVHFRFLIEQASRGLVDSVELLSDYKGLERWFIITAQPLSKYPGYVHWRLDDVTQKHMVDKVIREEREKLIDFTDNAPVGFFSVDEYGRFIFANATLARWLGEDLRVLLDEGELHTYLADPPKNAHPYDLIEGNHTRQIVEVRMKGTGGRTFLASVNQVVMKNWDGTVRTRAVVYDLTSEREMRRALEETQDRFQRFFEEAPLGIAQINNKRVLMDFNHAFAGMLGKPKNELAGLNFADLVSPEEQSRVVESLRRINNDEDVELPLEVSLIGKKKKLVTHMYARKFRDGSDTVLHFINVTQQKTLEEQFVQSQKMQAIGQLAGGVAHDFNNLLTAIIGFCDLLFLRHKPGDPSFADIMQIKQNSNRAANLVRQLLAFSRQQTLRPRVQDVTDILTELSHLLRRLIGASIDMDLVHGHDLGLVKVDEGQMEQVLINMAVNARDAMNGIGTLTIETENYENKSPRELITEELPPGEWVVVKVIDTGCGIEKDNMTRIFEPFFTTKEVGHGTGLGLATVYGIVRQTGGFIDVTSEVGKGTTFLIYLPRAHDSEEEKEPVENIEEEAHDLTGSERILLVEDEDAVRMFSQRALGNKGYEVLSASSGEAALNLIEEQKGKKLDLLITDVVMPGMDGPTLAQRVRQNNPNLKVIFMSGYTEDKLKGYLGANTYFLPKPFTLKVLASKVKEVLGGS